MATTKKQKIFPGDGNRQYQSRQNNLLKTATNNDVTKDVIYEDQSQLNSSMQSIESEPENEDEVKAMRKEKI